MFRCESFEIDDENIEIDMKKFLRVISIKSVIDNSHTTASKQQNFELKKVKKHQNSPVYLYPSDNFRLLWYRYYYAFQQSLQTSNDLSVTTLNNSREYRIKRKNPLS